MTRRLSNTQIMARRQRGRYNPGGHRGKSGDNGAGNHRYTPEERAAVDEARAAVDRAARREKAIVKEAEKHAKNLTELRQRLISQRINTPGRNVSRMEQNEMNLQLALVCAHGHTFSMSANDIIKSKATFYCPTCRAAVQSPPRADARLKFEMRCDEQGLDLVFFDTMRDKCDVQDRRTGEVYSIWPQNIDRWGCVPHDDRLIRFVADDYERVFVFRGQPPIVKHPFIAQLLAENPIEELEEPRKSGAAMAEFILQCQREGDRIVNFSMNKSWLKEDKYTWGQIPTSAALGKYFEDMRGRWL